ncbi:UNVERIFIED_CONTAM: hypothetical protein Sradi_2512800 [Sesamum radiatum]|uniref:Uncharacterized protein n=1 Tax=Sesamum radiatum TaxID=300843 RepID=A0AAW2SK67_SESRA
MTNGVLPPPARGHRGQGRGRGPPNPPRAKPADSAIPSSDAVSQFPSIPTDSGVARSDAAGPNSSQAPARPWDEPRPPVPLLLLQAQRHRRELGHSMIFY